MDIFSTLLTRAQLFLTTIIPSVILKDQWRNTNQHNLDSRSSLVHIHHTPAPCSWPDKHTDPLKCRRCRTHRTHRSDTLGKKKIIRSEVQQPKVDPQKVNGVLHCTSRSCNHFDEVVFACVSLCGDQGWLGEAVFTFAVRERVVSRSTAVTALPLYAFTAQASSRRVTHGVCCTSVVTHTCCKKKNTHTNYMYNRIIYD